MAEQQQEHVKSIVAVDVGSVNTRAVLIDLVDGAYRLVTRSQTRSTSGPPWYDAALGVRRALQAITGGTGRALLDAKENFIVGEKPNGAGADLFLATASDGRPLRVVLAGLMPDVSLNSAGRALASAYADVTDTLSLADVRTEAQQINAILGRQPDLIVIVGGTDAGAEAPVLALADVVRTALLMTQGAFQPAVIYAGNRALQRRIREKLEGAGKLFVAENVRPRLLEEQLAPARLELAAAYDYFKSQQGGGFAELSETSAIGLLPTAQTFTNMVNFMGELSPAPDGIAVLAVDVGSARTTLAGVVRGTPYVQIRHDLGLGHNAAKVTRFTTPNNIRRWLTWDASTAEIENYVFNKLLRPATVPQTAKDLQMEYALTREIVRLMAEQGRGEWRLQRSQPLAIRTLIGSGAVFSNLPHPGVAALLLLDALQPVGVTEVWADVAGLLPALGAVAYATPLVAVQILEAGDLLLLGSVVCAEGAVRRIGRGGLRVKITLPDGTVEAHTVRGGTLWTYPLPPGQSAQIEVRASRGLSVGGKSRLRLTLKGGAAGLIFDARGRPLPLPKAAEARARLYPLWMEGTKGRVRLRVDEIDPSQAEELVEALAGVETSSEVEAVEEGAALAEAARPEGGETAEPLRQRRGLFGRRRKQVEEEEADPVAAMLEKHATGEFPALAGDDEAEGGKKRRGRGGRRQGRKSREAEAAAPPDTAAPAKQADLDDLLLDDLRGDVGGTKPAAKPPERRRR